MVLRHVAVPHSGDLFYDVSLVRDGMYEYECKFSMI
jgi:hypothetical protein